MARAASRGGLISVETTEQGLPIKIDIEPDELRRAPEELAREISRLCRRAANRAGLARRTELEAAGMSSDMLALTGLPTAEDIAREEYVEESEHDYEPQSWLRSV
ncbi:hypothetical protein [Nocardia sp. NPDC019395]|uniref:hypothetical protein n=1 Tax=Nocardia sp. NPDC019395 TaxID=3154686 RepID=UPI0033D582ED